MLIFDKIKIGDNFYKIRRKRGMTREEVAEKADISDRTYADIERGTVNMRLETLLHICEALRITPDEILTEDIGAPAADDIFAMLGECTPKERETLMKLIAVFLEGR